VFSPVRPVGGQKTAGAYPQPPQPAMPAGLRPDARRRVLKVQLTASQTGVCPQRSTETHLAPGIASTASRASRGRAACADAPRRPCIGALKPVTTAMCLREDDQRSAKTK
jgi:hypothetical protein